MHENDPNRLNQPRVGDPVENNSMTGVVTVSLIAAALAALALLFWPGERTATSVTENTPRVERPTAPSTPPANKPVTPAPTPPQ